MNAEMSDSSNAHIVHSLSETQYLSEPKLVCWTLLSREASQVRMWDRLCYYKLGECISFIPLILAPPSSSITWIISLHISEVITAQQKEGCLLCGSASCIIWS